jgi:hypothetical protein
MVFDDQNISIAEDLFQEEGFYRSPKNTELTLVIGTKSALIGNSVVFNMEESNSKIPVYSYNSGTFAKYLSGKKIVTGSIALRRTTSSEIAAILYRKGTETQREALKLTLTEQNSVIDDIIAIEEEYGVDASEIKDLQALKASNSATLLILDSDDWTSLQDLEDSNGNSLFTLDNSFDAGGQLLYHTNSASLSDVSFQINFKGGKTDETVTINNILFVKKTTELNIGRADVIDVFQFIGNPSNPAL